MGRIHWARLGKPVEQFERIIPLPVTIPIHDMNPSALDEDAKIRVLQLPGHRGQKLFALRPQLVGRTTSSGDSIFFTSCR